MEHEIKVGTVLIKENTDLPEGLRVDLGPALAGWRVVQDCDGYGLDRAIQKAGWTFFCVAGEVKATVFGIDKQSTLRRAIERLLARGKSEDFNSLEIAQVSSVGSERFPLVRYVTVSAKWRHVQESRFLARGKDLADLNSQSASITQLTRIANLQDRAFAKTVQNNRQVSILNPQLFEADGLNSAVERRMIWN